MLGARAWGLAETHSQLTLPFMTMSPYASILSLMMKSPSRLMLRPDLTDPATSKGPRRSKGSSLFTLRALLKCRPDVYPVEELAA